MSRSQRRYGRKAYRRIRIHKWQSRHHKRCVSNGGQLFENGQCNISVVRKDDHAKWHDLFSNLLPPTICEVINQKWLDPRWKFVCIPADGKETHEDK